MSLTCSSEDEMGMERAAFFPGKVRKKAVHNQVERRRKDKINGWIIHIGELLPEKDPKKQSKNGILERAVEYILYLKETNKKLMLGQCNEVQIDTVNRFEKRVKDLEQQNKSYVKLLRKAGITPLTPLEEELWKPKNGKYPKNLSVEQVSALQSKLNQNGFINKGNESETNENDNTANCPITKETVVTVSASPVTTKTKPSVEKTKMCRTTNTNKSNTNKSNSCKLGNSPTFPGGLRNNMVLTQALPTEPLMSTTQNVSLVQQTCNGISDSVISENNSKQTTLGSNEVNIVNTQQPLIVINDQNIPLVQNMLTFQSKPIMFGNENALPVIPQQFATNGPTIEILNTGNTSVQKTNTSSVCMSINQNSPSTVQSNVSLPVMINNGQIVQGTGSLANNIVIRPQDPTATAFSFCTQDASQMIQHSGIVPACAQPSQSSKTVIGVPNNAQTLTNSVLPLIGQTMAFNQPGQMITFGPGTILTTPTPTGPIQTQQSWPSALLLPNGQIIPVVSQPSVVYSSNPQPLSGGLIVTPNPNPHTQVQNCSVSPQKTASVTSHFNSTVSTSISGTVISKSPLSINNYIPNQNSEKNAACSKSPSSQAVGSSQGSNSTKSCLTQSRMTNNSKTNSRKRAPANVKNNHKEKAKAANKATNKVGAVVSTALNTNSTTINTNEEKKGNNKKAMTKPEELIPTSPIQKQTVASNKALSKEITETNKNHSSPSIPGNVSLSRSSENAQSNDILARATESIFSRNLTEVTSAITNAPKSQSGLTTTNNKVLQADNNVFQLSPTNERGKKGDTQNNNKKENSKSVTNNPKKQPEKRLNEPKQPVETQEPPIKKAKNTPKPPDPPNSNEKVLTTPQTQTETVYSNSASENGKAITNTDILRPSSSTVNQASTILAPISNQETHPNNQHFTPNVTQESCQSNMDLGSFVTNNVNCPSDQELPSLILSSLTDENETPSVNNNTNLQYLSLSPPDHYNHELPVKVNNLATNQNSYDRIRNVPSSTTNPINSIVPEPFCNNPTNQMQENFGEQRNCNKAGSILETQNLQQEEKKTGNGESSTIAHCVSNNSLPLANLSVSSNDLLNKQPKGLTHLSVTNSFLTNQVTTLPAISNQACLNSTASIYSRCGLDSIHQGDTRNGTFATAAPSQNFLTLSTNESNTTNHETIGSGSLTNNAPNSCYPNTSFNKEQSNHQNNNLGIMTQGQQSQNSMRHLTPSPFNHGLERNNAPPKSRAVLSQNSTRPVPNSIYSGISIYNDTTNNNTHSRFENRVSLPAPTTLGGSHSISNYSAEALIGHHNVSNSTNSQTNLAFNSSQQIQCSQNVTLAQNTPTCSQSNNRPLLSYSAESLLQNQTHSERKKGNENSYTQHFHHLRSPTRTSSSLMGQNASFAQPMFPPCSTFSSVNSVPSTEINPISQITVSECNPIPSSNYNSSSQQFGNHFSSGSFLMRPLPPHVPDVSHSTHRTSSQPTFSIGCTINSNTNDFSQKHLPVGLQDNSISTRNSNGIQNTTNELGSQNQHGQNQHQRNGCLFPSSSPQLLHGGSGLTLPDSHFSLLQCQNNQTNHGSSKSDTTTMLNHYPQNQPQNHTVNNFLPGQFVQGMTGNHNINLDTTPNNNSNQISRIMPMESSHNYLDSSKKESSARNLNNVSRNPTINHSSKTLNNKSGKTTSKRKPSSEVQNTVPPISIASYDKSHNMPYFSVPELATHSDLQSCSINRFFPGCQRTNVQNPVNHQQNRGTALPHVSSQTSSHIPAISGATDISRNSPYNPLFRPQSQSSLNLNFQPPSFTMNPLQRVPTSSGSPTSTSSNACILPCQLSTNNANNSSCGTVTHVPNFNLSNIFPDISVAPSSDSLANSLNPIKFHSSNSIITHPPTHPGTTQGTVDIPSLSQGTGNSNHSNRTSVTRPPPLYHSRAPHPPPPPGIHNGFNSILGTGAHAFDRGSGQMVMGIPNNPGSAPPHFGHATSHPPFGNVLSTLNFPVHDTH